MKKTLITALTLLITSPSIHAKSWKIQNLKNKRHAKIY